MYDLIIVTQKFVCTLYSHTRNINNCTYQLLSLPACYRSQLLSILIIFDNPYINYNIRVWIWCHCHVWTNMLHYLVWVWDIAKYMLNFSVHKTWKLIYSLCQHSSLVYFNTITSNKILVWMCPLLFTWRFI